MSANPFLGVVMHAVGGVAHGTFYAPLHRVKKWSWESFWLVQGLAAWVIAPWLVATIAGTQPIDVLTSSPRRSLMLAYGFGVMWGFGSLTFGLTMRYLGMSLGMAVALGFCATFGTLIPPIVGQQIGQLCTTAGGLTILTGVVVCLIGIGQCGLAGKRKESELTDEQKKEGVKEFALVKGFGVAVFSGIMSAGFAYGINAGKPIAERALALGAPELFTNSPVFIVVMAGGFTVNCIWCLLLNLKNKSLHEYLSFDKAPIGANVFYAASAGLIWYTGFMFYGMGTTKMGEHDFSSWSIHLAFVIVFSTLCGIWLKEWQGVSRKTMALVWLGLAILILSTVITGWGNYLSSS